MALYMNTDIRWYVGAQAVACHAKSARFASTCAPLDKTSICSADGWVELLGGRKSGSFDLALMSDMAEGGLDERLFAALGTSGVAQSWSIGSADGSPGYCCTSLATKYVPVQGAPGELALAAASGVSSGPVARGMLVHPDTTARTSSSSGTARQVGAVSSSQRVYAALHVISVSGTTPTLTIKVQSDDGSGMATPTDRITFTTETDATAGYQLLSAAGAITDDWWRVTWTVGGTDPSFAFAVVLGIG